MFTGIIEAPCPLGRVRHEDGLLRLEVDLAPLRGLSRVTDAPAAPVGGPGDGPAGPGEAPPGPLVALGDSVAVNGVCLTVARLDGDRATFEVIPESLSRTALGDAREGQRVNVERALRFGDRLDGHLVQGHVEGRGSVAARQEVGGELRLTIDCGPAFARRCLPKGSVTLHGVSLTIAELHDDAFVVALVPHTLERTNLGELAVGEAVHLEPDVVGQWVLRAVQQMGFTPPEGFDLGPAASGG